jgi:oligopeptide/dipeptide ABC transporter ATP-binding protein
MSDDDAEAADQQPFLLEINELQTFFKTEDGLVKAVNGTNLNLRRGEVLGLVGESGSGKSVTGLSILGLIDQPGEIVGGEIWFDGRSLLDLSNKDLVKLRGRQISMIFQQPISSINPVLSLGAQVAEVLRVHKNMAKKEAWEQAVDLLRQVGIPDPEKRARSYSHQISGGQAQRVMIAMALALNPVLLIADEATTALDVTIQAQILDLIRNVTDEYDTSVILITHDLGVIAEMAERVAVMYAGHILEQADVRDLFDQPLHPYTQGLIASVPQLSNRKARLEIIPGTVPSLIGLSDHCRFASRCKARLNFGLEICTQQMPDMIEATPNHFVRCWLYQDTEGHQAPLRQEVEPR